jgi:hypothetical protein
MIYIPSKWDRDYFGHLPMPPRIGSKVGVAFDKNANFNGYNYDHFEDETVAYVRNYGDNLTVSEIETIEDYIRLIKYGDGVVFASITANLSIVNGSAFVTNPSIDFRPYLGFKVTLNDGTQNLVGFLKSAGGG